MAADGTRGGGDAPRLICLACGATVPAGAEACPACGEQLTAPPGDPQELVSVLESTDSSKLPVVKSVLQAAEIPFLVQGDEGFGLFPVGGVTGFFEDHSLGVNILVPLERAEEARALLTSDFSDVASMRPETEAGEDDDL